MPKKKSAASKQALPARPSLKKMPARAAALIVVCVPIVAHRARRVALRPVLALVVSAATALRLRAVPVALFACVLMLARVVRVDRVRRADLAALRVRVVSAAIVRVVPAALRAVAPLADPVRLSRSIRMI